MRARLSVLSSYGVLYCPTVLVRTDLSSKEPHRQVGVGRMVTSGSLGGIMVSTLARNARDVRSIPTVGAIFPIFLGGVMVSGVGGLIWNAKCVTSIPILSIFITSHDTGCPDHDPV